MAHEKQMVDYQTGEVDVVNDNFVQLYVDKLDLIIEMTGENHTAVKIFVWLLQHMDKRNALVISQQALAEALDLSRQTIHTSTKYLREKKAVDILKSGNTNIYAVNAQIAWKADANGKKYALFNAAVYISDSEQDKPLFDTQLVGHAKPRLTKKRVIKPLAKTDVGSAEAQPTRD
ncbi:replication/maintenance protein RepL [Fibrella sp. HMF5335]|uniref:Replication/maintenance protein RepL n=1 Tax=Fibrella rubiginis TaxID=2817060 RepID=A0A939GIZ1_9BACT|nr:replication/maintenance protein RepL [Fibrella rubiginis]MBO0940077.1 replication/maintenance protein RepL [Fibrella rubiginis]